MFIKNAFIVAFFPIYKLFEIFEPREEPLISLIKRAIKIFLLEILIIPLWLLGYLIIFYTAGSYLGYVARPIPISGTGSMYPTFPKSNEKDLKKQAAEIIGAYNFLPYPNGFALLGRRYFGHDLERGDIVVAENAIIAESTKKLYGTPSGVVKRIIALPGDAIELRDGVVYLNRTPLREAYTYKPHSTFGETFLSECKKITVPANKVFIMGDNRKGSGDSREDGFVDYNDILYVLPLNRQKGTLDKNYRDTSKDLDESSKIRLDRDKYLELLNEERKKAGVQALKYQPLLEKSAFKRGGVMLKYDDFSFEASRSGYTMLKAVSDSGYSNIVYGEEPAQGYYEADELIENQFQFPESKKFLLYKDYQEIGISEVEGTLNGCPTQVVVLHFAGYIPPNYSRDIIDSWKKALKQLKEIQPGWQKLKDNQQLYKGNQQDADRINEIISTRITNIEAIVSKMEANKWLSASEKDYANKDEELGKEQEALSQKLNNQ